jgi:hypothetical protein
LVRILGPFLQTVQVDQMDQVLDTPHQVALIYTQVYIEVAIRRVVLAVAILFLLALQAMILAVQEEVYQEVILY